MWPSKRRTIKSVELEPGSDPTSLGNILIEMRLITSKQLAKLVVDFEEYKKQERLLGQFLIRQRVITETQLEIALIRQQMLRGKVDQKSVRRVIQLASHSDEKLNNSLTELLMMVGTKKSHGTR